MVGHYVPVSVIIHSMIQFESKIDRSSQKKILPDNWTSNFIFTRLAKKLPVSVRGTVTRTLELHVDIIFLLNKVYAGEEFKFLVVSQVLFIISGMPNSSGLWARRNVISSEDAETIKRLKDAGGIPIGLTNCSELCMWWESYNVVYGRTINAYNHSRIVGGSSGK